LGYVGVYRLVFLCVRGEGIDVTVIFICQFSSRNIPISGIICWCIC